MTAAPWESRISQPYRRTPVLARALVSLIWEAVRLMTTDQVLFGVGLILVLAVGSQVLASRLGSRH